MEPPEEEVKKPPPKFTHRRLPVPHDLWAQVLKLSSELGVSYQDLVIRLLDDGIKVRAWERVKHPDQKPLPAWRPPPRPAIHTVLEVGKKRIGHVELVQVPAAGETVMIHGKPYTVSERAWSYGKRVVAFLRLKAWG
jgi:hypothetical protein